MRKTVPIIMVLIVSMVLALMAGCQGSPTTETAATSASPATSTAESTPETLATEAEIPAGTVRYMFWNKDQEPAMRQIADQFTAKYPQLKVELEVVAFDQYWLKLDAGASSGDLPDTFWINGPNFIKYASNGMLMPLDDASIDFSAYPQSLVDLYSYENAPYAVPKDFDTIALYYNKKIFDNAGVAYPDSSWDWTKLRETALELNDPDNGIFGLGVPLVDQEGYFNLILQNGGSIISDDKKTSGFADAATVEAIKFWSDLVVKDKVSPALAQFDESPHLTLFQNGKVAMQFGGSWRQAGLNKDENFKTNYDVAPLPKGMENACIIHGLGNAASATTKQPEATKAWIQFLGSKEAAEILAKTGTVIPAYNGTQDQWIASNPNVNLQVFLDMVEVTRPYPVSKATSKWQEVLKKNLTEVWKGEMTAEDACAIIAVDMNKLLSEE